MHYQIQTYSPKRPIPFHSFFVVSKGLNSGKPLWQACANCFVVSTPSAKSKEFLFWYIFSLWKKQSFYEIHRGSSIPFISVEDFRKLVDCEVSEEWKEHEAHQRAIATIRSLDEKERQFFHNKLLIEETKRAMMRKISRK